MLLHIMKDRGTYQRFDLYFSTLVLCRRQSKSRWSKSIIILVPTIDVEMIRGNFLKAEMMGGKKKKKKRGGKAKRYGRNGRLQGETTEYGPNAMHTRRMAEVFCRIIMEEVRRVE